MQKIEKLLQKRAAELLAEGTVERVLAWQAGEFFYDNTPAAVDNATSATSLSITSSALPISANI